MVCVIDHYLARIGGRQNEDSILSCVEGQSCCIGDTERRGPCQSYTDSLVVGRLWQGLDALDFDFVSFSDTAGLTTSLFATAFRIKRRNVFGLTLRITDRDQEVGPPRRARI